MVRFQGAVELSELTWLDNYLGPELHGDTFKMFCTIDGCEFRFSRSVFPKAESLTISCWRGGHKKGVWLSSEIKATATNLSTDLDLGENLVRHKKASQSSDDFGRVASTGVDGHSNGITHTKNERGAWWQVDLGRIGKARGKHAFDVHARGRLIRVQFQGQNYLHIRELEAFGTLAGKGVKK